MKVLYYRQDDIWPVFYYGLKEPQHANCEPHNDVFCVAETQGEDEIQADFSHLTRETLLQMDLRVQKCIPRTLKRAAEHGRHAAPTHTCVVCKAPLFLENCLSTVFVHCAACLPPQPRSIIINCGPYGKYNVQIGDCDPAIVLTTLQRAVYRGAAFVDANPKFTTNDAGEWVFPEVQEPHLLIQPTPFIVPRTNVTCLPSDEVPDALLRMNVASAVQQRQFIFNVLRRTLECEGLQKAFGHNFRKASDIGMKFGPSNTTFQDLKQAICVSNVLCNNDALERWINTLLDGASKCASFEQARAFCYRMCSAEKYEKKVLNFKEMIRSVLPEDIRVAEPPDEHPQRLKKRGRKPSETPLLMDDTQNFQVSSEVARDLFPGASKRPCVVPPFMDDEEAQMASHFALFEELSF